jgi:hypothetical protein
LALKLAYELAETNIPNISTSRYIGIVLFSRPMVEDALKTPNAVESLTTKIWNWIADDARKEQTSNSVRLIQSKREGIVTNIPPVTDYDPVQLASSKDFDAGKPPGNWFSYAGVIWSVSHPKREP